MTDEARAGEPRTEAGRALLSQWTRHNNPMADEIRAAILTIEREAAAAPSLNVDRLLLAWSIHMKIDHPDEDFEAPTSDCAQRVAAEYARLSESAPPVAPLGETP